MQYTEFQKRMSQFTVFSLRDAQRALPDFHRQRLSEWRKKGYIRQIIRGFYTFSSNDVDETVLFVMANTIYAPSYISLEMAFSYYGLIPEGVYTITSVSSRKTEMFETDFGNFQYSHIKRNLFWGYRLEKSTSGRKFFVAEPEKALVDYLYLHPEVRSREDFRSLRINEDVFQELIHTETLRKYAKKTQKQSVIDRLDVLLKSVQ